MKNAFGEVGVDYTVENVQDALKTMLCQLEEASRVIVPRYITVPKFSMANVTDPNKALKEVLEAFTEMELLAIGVHIRYGVSLAILKSKFIADFQSTVQLINDSDTTFCTSGLYESKTMQEVAEALCIA